MIEQRINETAHELVQTIEKLKSDVVVGMQQKPEFQDLEAMAHKLHTKADFQKV